MANIGFSLIGKNKFDARLKRASLEARNKVEIAVNKAGHLIRSEAVKSISRGSRTGITYSRGGISHTASARGEFPKTDTGELVTNITVEPDGHSAITVGSRIQAPQGFWLETKEPSQGGRPWLAPVIKKHTKRVFNLVEKAVKEAIE